MAKNLQHSFSDSGSESLLLTGKAVFRNSLHASACCALKIIADRILDLIVGCNTILVAVRPVEVDVSRARQSAGQCDILSESADALTEKEKERTAFTVRSMRVVIQFDYVQSWLESQITYCWLKV
ncbi:hypothetical protein F1728_05365 [Gimesia benthica]|uniref:Uncharacterized protein n=1 Tax=Gimesia benthica TaxID=2608982 RepID=A0A6I6A9V5_9PLAN|nr:hypothetical protein [Gimesia benthica]QGQ22155.1 hypothetical protein F1728_05365 [Gimesia benthica]